MIKLITKLLATSSMLLFTYTSYSQVAPSLGNLLITEIARQSINQDFIEIYNQTSNDITLANCKLIKYYNGTASNVYDFSSEGTGDIIVPQNGFLIVGRNTTESNFESYWNVDLTFLGANYNNTSTSLAIYGTATYAIKYSGTSNTDDGTLIDSTTITPSKPRRVYQAPIGSFTTEIMNNVSDLTPGSFQLYDHIKWDYIYYGSWKPSTPLLSSSTSDALIYNATINIADGTVLNNLYLSGSSVNNTTETITINGDLTIVDNSAFSIRSLGSVIVGGTSTIENTGSSSALYHNLWSSPFTDSPNILSTFSGVNPCDVYTYKSSNQQWKYDYATPFSTTCNGSSVTFNTTNIVSSPEGNPDGMFDLGRGYFIPGNVNPTRSFSSTNSLNNGTLYVPLYGSSVAVAGGNDWNLIGNPYPSSLNVSSFLSKNTNRFNAVYIYNGATGAYETYNSGSSFNVAPGQGFFVDASTNIDGFFSNTKFTNSMRRTGNSTFRKKSHDSGNGKDTTIAFISINSQTGLRDQIHLYIDSVCIDSIDSKFEARKLANDHNLNLASLIKSNSPFSPELFVFNGVKSMVDKESKIIDLFVQTDGVGYYTIQIDSLRDMPLGISIVLEDRVMGKMENLRTGNYTFNSPGDTLQNRFFIHLSNDASITNVGAVIQEHSLQLNQTKTNIILSLITSTNISSVQLYDILGKSKFSSFEVNHSEIFISKNQLIKGIYIINLTDVNGKSYTERIFIN
jgi:hypothetical protein